MFTTTYHPQTNGQVERFNRTILSALRHYVAEHPRDWDLFSDALTYAYNTQAHASTMLAPFELVLSRPPPVISIESRPTMDAADDAYTYRERWKYWLTQLMSTASAELEKRQARYKRNFDARLRLPVQRISEGSFVFLRRDHTPRTESRHKLAPVADGPFKVVGADEHTVVVKIDENVERVSRDRVELAPKPAEPVTQDTVQDTSGANAAPTPTGLASIIPRTQRDADDLPGTWTRMGTRRRLPALPPGILVNDKSESDDRRTRTIADDPAVSTLDDNAIRSLNPDTGNILRVNPLTRLFKSVILRNAVDIEPKAPSKMKKVTFNEEPIDGHTASYEGRSSAANPGDLVRLRLIREPGVREVEVHEYDKKYRLRSRVYSAPSGEGYQEPADLGPETPEVSEAETPIEDVPAAECLRESAAQSTRVTRQYTRNRGLDTQPMSSSSSAAVAIAPEYAMESIVDHGYAEDGELLYRIRWYGYAADQDTWEPVRHIPRSHIVRFSRLRGISLPSHMNEAMVG